MAPTQEYDRVGANKEIKFSSDEEMVEYYREAIIEAVVFCLTKGFPEEYITSLDIDGFGEIYKYLKRISARDHIKFVGGVRVAMGSDKNDYKKYMGFHEVWLPVQESDNKSNGKKIQKPFTGIK